MLGALISFAFVVGLIGVCRTLFSPWVKSLDPAEQVGVLGLFGMGLAGLDTLILGLLPGGLNWGVWIEGGLAVAGIGMLAAGWSKEPIRARLPKGVGLAALAGLALMFLVALIGALGPSDRNDWDSLAYHLAVPKIWLEQGRIVEIPFIHHSNFPFALDNLYVWGLKWGGMSGAKAFATAVYGLGMLALFGLARRRAGEKAGWIAALAFAGIPCALWESGTAYIDVGHGLFAGLGILYAAEFVEGRSAESAWRAAVFLALGCATKYTGLQTLFAAGLVVVGASVIYKPSRAKSAIHNPKSEVEPTHSSPSLKGGTVRALILFAVAAAVLAGPWYVKNFFWTGNPVYPFFYEQIGSRNWDAFSAKIYKEEQQTFGVGHAPADLGHAILGLAYQPGRYVNPAQTEGGGMPTGALGAAVVASWLLWLFSGRARRFEGAILAMTGVSLLFWFVLSQQSRYLVTLGIPAAVLAGVAFERLRAGPILAGLVALQGAWSLYVGKFFHVDPKLPVVLGQVSAEEYEAQMVPFSQAAKAIDAAVTPQGKVALFDEVFGYYLNVPYFWANPGHSTRIPWDRIQSGPELADALKDLGITHVYLSLAFTLPDQRTRWIEAAGLAGSGRPFTAEERAGAFQDLRNKWRVLLAEAVATGRLRPIGQPKGGILFEIVL